MTEPSAFEVSKIHNRADTDSQPSALHHTLGPSGLQASPGDHTHDGRSSKRLYSPPPVVTGSRGANAALTSLLTELARLKIIVDNTSA